MQVLLRDSRDNTLAVIEINEANYYAADQKLRFFLANDNAYVIDVSDREAAEYIIVQLYNKGRVNVTDYPATYEECDGGEDDDPEDM